MSEKHITGGAAAGIVTAGINHRTAGLKGLGPFALDEIEVRNALERLNDRFAEALIVATCNRTEVTVVTAHPDRAAASAINDIVFRTSAGPERNLPDGFFEVRGRESVSHLFRLAAGMESMLIGEREILGQVRHAAQIARESSTLGHVIGQLARMAVATGRRVRDETDLESEAGSLGSRILNLARAHVGPLDGKALLVVGAGQAASSVMSTFESQTLELRFVANRTVERARNLAGRFGARAIAVDAISRIDRTPDVIVLATPSKDRSTHLSAALARPTGEPVAVFDLGQASLDLPTGDGVRSWSLADIYDSEPVPGPVKSDTAALSESIIDHETSRFFSWWAGENVTPVVRRLVEMTEQIQRREVAYALRKLGPISESQEEVVRKLGSVIAKRILQNPISRIADRHDGRSLAGAAAELFDLGAEIRTTVEPAPQTEPANRADRREGA